MLPNHKTSFKAVLYTEAFVNMKRGGELVWLYHSSQQEILVGTDFAIGWDEIPFFTFQTTANQEEAFAEKWDRP